LCLVLLLYPFEGHALMLRFGTGPRSPQGVVIYVIVLLISALLYIYRDSVFRKEVANLQTDISSKDTDPIWNIKEMMTHARFVHKRVMEATVLGDADHVKDIVTEDMYDYFSKRFADMKQRNRKMMVDGLDVTHVEVVNTANYVDDSEDFYTVYITGTIQWVLSNSENGDEVDHSTEDVNDAIRELYQFARSNDKWLLCYTQSNPSESDLNKGDYYNEVVS